MANPQKEDGHIRISTELWTALVKIRIPGEARQMLDFIIRKTYGYNKKEDRISTSQFAQATGMKHNAIHKNRRKLIEMNVITVSQKGHSQILTYSIQKNYEKWKPYPKKGTVSQKVTRCIPKGDETVSQKGTHNKTINTIQYTGEFFSDSCFSEIWEDFIKMREQIKKPLTQRAVNLILKKLFRFDIDIAKMMLEQSILNCWQDVYPIKEKVETKKFSDGTEVTLI